MHSGIRSTDRHSGSRRARPPTRSITTNGSPDRDARLPRQPERVGLADAERLVERIDVADDLVAAELVGRVRVDRQQSDGLGIPPLLLPDLRPAQEKPLNAGVAVEVASDDDLG